MKLTQKSTRTTSSHDTSTVKLIRVVGAAIVRDGRLFCAQRGAGKQLAGKWEFPGGKIEPGETPEQALRREIREELRCDVRVGRQVCTTDNHYAFGTVELSTYLCELTGSDPVLTEHQDARWLAPADLPSLDWAPADREAMGILRTMEADDLATGASAAPSQIEEELLEELHAGFIGTGSSPESMLRAGTARTMRPDAAHRLFSRPPSAQGDMRDSTRHVAMPSDIYGPMLIANRPGHLMGEALLAELGRPECTGFIWSVAFISAEEILSLKQHILNFFGWDAESNTAVSQGGTSEGIRFADRRGTIITSTYQNFNSPRAFWELLQLAKTPGLDGRLDIRVWDPPQGSPQTAAYKDAGFHAKGYAFSFDRRDAGTGARTEVRTVYVGSSNLTQKALNANREWNLRVSSLKNGDIVSQISSELQAQIKQSRPLSGDWIKAYQDGWQPSERFVRTRLGGKGKLIPVTQATEDLVGDAMAGEPASADRSGEPSVIRPNPMQKEALAALRHTREEGHTSGIVISATGTGKTYLSALDVRQFQEELARHAVDHTSASASDSAVETKGTPDSPFRLLYIVGQRQILVQAMRSYRRVLGCEPGEMALLSGQKPSADDAFLAQIVHLTGRDASKLVADPAYANVRYVFATVDTLSEPAVLSAFPKDWFDYVVADEAHHSVTKTYLRIIDHFRPQTGQRRFLLGMTATPERTQEGADGVFHAFGNNVVYQIRLRQALDNDLLAPFHYYGIHSFRAGTDEPGAKDVTVTNDDTGTEALSSAKNDIRKGIAESLDEGEVQYILANLQTYSIAGTQVCGIIFCSRDDEARRLSELMNKRIYPWAERKYKTRVVTSKSKEDRDQAIRDLESGDLDYIITVDLFNEGVDIPSLNQVVMLRETKSSIIFTQQLGRGLRKAPRKQSVMVVDFIGNWMKTNYLIPIALFGNSGDRDRNRSNMQTTTLGLSSVSFDPIAKDLVLRSIEQTNYLAVAKLREDYRRVKMEVGHIPTLLDLARADETLPMAIATRPVSVKMDGEDLPLRRVYPSFVIGAEARSKDKDSQSMARQLAQLAVDLPQSQDALALVTWLMRGMRPHELVALAALYGIRLSDIEGSDQRGGLPNGVLHDGRIPLDEQGHLTADELGRLVARLFPEVPDDVSGSCDGFGVLASRSALRVLGSPEYFLRGSSRARSEHLIVPLQDGPYSPTISEAASGSASDEGLFDRDGTVFTASPTVRGWLRSNPLFAQEFSDAVRTGLYLSRLLFAGASERGERVQGGFVSGEKYSLYEVMRLCGWDKELPPLNIGGYFFDQKTSTLPIFIKYDDDKYEDRFIDQTTLDYFSKDDRHLDSREIRWLEGLGRRHENTGQADGPTVESAAATNAVTEQAASAGRRFVPVFVQRKPGADDKDKDENEDQDTAKKSGSSSPDPFDTSAYYYYIGHAVFVDQVTETEHDKVDRHDDGTVTRTEKPVVRMDLHLDRPVDQQLFSYLTGRAGY